MLNFQEKKYFSKQEKNILIQDFPKTNNGKFRKQYFVMKRQKIKCFNQSAKKKFWVKTIAPFKLNGQSLNKKKLQ
jgi:hypothetical protein